MRGRRFKIKGSVAIYHCMSRAVNGERLFERREKEVLRKMLWQVADFCGVEVLTYCILSNHFHVLLRVDDEQVVSDSELMRRYRVLYPKPTKYQEAAASQIAKTLAEGGEEAELIRSKLRARMGDVSEFMKTVKQRFSVHFNRSHERFGTLWAERFKSVLVEGRGYPLQTVAAYIDLNPVRAGIVEDPKDYRFCGYAEAVAGEPSAQAGMLSIWGDFVARGVDGAMRAHRLLMFGTRAGEGSLGEMTRQKALEILQRNDGKLSTAAVLRCRIRYFSDGAILGSQEFVGSFADDWQAKRGRKRPPRANPMRGADWGDLMTIQGLRRQVFG